MAALLVSFIGAACGGDGTGATGVTGVTGSTGAGGGGSGGFGGGAGGESGGGAGGEAGLAEVLAAHMTEAESEGFSGVVAVADPRGIVLSQGFGLCVRESRAPCTADTVFDIGSLTKQFTAAAIMARVDSGDLSVDDTLASFFAAVPADKAAITIHQLLTHTAGLPDILGDDYDAISREDFLALAFAAPLLSTPGTSHAYSNVGYSILGAILELSRNASYESTLSAEVFTKAGIEHTGYVLPDWSSLLVAHGYAGRDAFGSPLDQLWDADGPYWHLRANGGLLSTAADMIAWHEALLGTAVLSERAKTALFTPFVEEGPGFGTFYGYGWVVEETAHGKVVWHNGGNDYFFADFWRYLDAGVTVFVASNAYEDYADNDDLARTLAEIVLDGG